MDGSKSNSKDCAAVAVSYETDSGGADRNLNFCFFTIEFLLFYNRVLTNHQWMIAQMVERLLCTRVQIPAPAPYEITL